MFEFKWTKMNGAGNSFVVAHHPQESLTEKQKARLAKDIKNHTKGLCKKHQTEGVVVLVPSVKKYDFDWIFFNKDASSADMCGNAACCVASYVFTKKLFLEKTVSAANLPRWYKPGKYPFVVFKTNFRVFVAEKLNNNKVQILLPLKRKIKGSQVFYFKNKKYSYRYINTAVPHAVIKLPQWPKTRQQWTDLKHTAQALRKKTTHHLKGMNVSFYSLSKKPGGILARTFERGVEGFTPACGTGALATARVAKKAKQHTIKVKMPGGSLTVHFLPHNKTVALSSPVQWE